MINYFDQKQLDRYLNKRHSETKIGQNIYLISDLKDLENCNAEYVLLGIPEDIGVRANHGLSGTQNAWISFVKAYLNTQENQYNSSDNVAILGEIDCHSEIGLSKMIDTEDEDYPILLSDLVQQIDDKVSNVLEQIFNYEKTPILIGGGHNNAYGIMKGFYKSHEQKINVLNIDAHTDLRHPDFRHSGNGFSYAFKEGYLNKYYVFGLHENYTPKYIFEFIDQRKDIKYYLYDELLHLNPLEKLSKLKSACNFLDERFGLELDCDAIAHFDSSAKTPSGFDIGEIRNMIKLLNNNQLHYVHICEAIPDKHNQIGKAISYFVSDLLRE